MELRQLKYFVRIVELGSLSRAAEALYVAQPALSQQISRLEADLQVKLLTRSVRGVSPTEAGAVFYQNAQVVLRQIERIRENVKHAAGHPQGKVSIGMPTSVAYLLAAPLMLAVKSRYPDIHLQITESLSGHLEELVANGRIEMSILFDRNRKSDHMHLLPLLDEELYLVTAVGSGNGADEVSLEEAVGESFVLPGAANATRQIIDELFARRGLSLRMMAEMDSLSTIASVVSAGIGATITTLSAISNVSDTLQLRARRLQDANAVRRVSLCSYESVSLNTAAQVIFNLIPEVVGELVGAGLWEGATLISQRKT
jgi:LysR family nitrogen assimilation transcriptional regulator